VRWVLLRVSPTRAASASMVRGGLSTSVTASNTISPLSSVLSMVFS
jgi:hypothetical protein